jgi:hypothetical protein
MISVTSAATVYGAWEPENAAIVRACRVPGYLTCKEYRRPKACMSRITMQAPGCVISLARYWYEFTIGLCSPAICFAIVK